MSSSSLPCPPDAVVVMDRFVSASSTQDATNSLNEIVDGFKNKQWHADWVLDHEDMAEHLVWWLQNATLKGREIPCGEDGVRLVCELYQFLVQQSRKALEKPTPGALLESLLDVLDHPDHPNPIYVRVLALNILEDMSRRHKAVASNQWMEAPNGLHRLKDILATDVEANPLEEAVRGQALVVTKLLAKEAPLAKVFLFADVHCILLSICESSGGLTGGERTVIDSLQLVVELLRHADANMQDYVWQSRNVAPILHKLVNLTFGDAIVHPGKKYDTKQTESKSLGHDDDDENDGLDNLLGHGGSNSEVANEKKDKAAQESEQDILASLPHLLPSEVEVVQLAFKIIGLLLESESVRRTMWKKQFLLFSMIWDMAWLIPVLPPHAPTFALIPPSLQQEALSLIANKLNDPENMAHHHGLDRLMRLVATGGEIAKTLDDKLAISQAALAVLRHTLSGDVIHATLMRTLAPPPIPDDDENAKPPGPTEIHKLWGTVTENLPVEKSDQRTIFLSGAFGGLGLMLCDEQSKEIMSRVSPISFDHILESLFSEQEELIQCSMLRFLCEWIYQCPLVAHNLLSSTSSMHLAEMAATPSDHQSLVHLLLGLAMEYLNNEEDCGGWTRAGILHIITKIGISKYTNSLEGLKTTKNPKLPWVVADAEYKSWKDFCNKAVLIVRKRVVEELAGRSGEDDDGSDDDGVENAAADTSTSGKGTKPLRRLISQQARENEELRQQLEEAQAKVTSQENQINAWKRRIESNPTQLDTMLNEFQLKTARLEETIRMKEVEAEKFRSEKDATNKDLQEKLSQSEKEIERLRTKEQETRDDLERTEQEMQALSQAYSNLEIEYQRAQSSTSVVAPAGEASQQQGSHQAAGSGSLEVVTLRAENERLRTDAKAADDWMAMAVQKMNEMGAANIELQQQVTALTGQLNVAQTSTQRDVRSQEVLQREKEAFEAELQQTRSSLMTIKIELENERSKSAQLERYVEHSDAELSDLRGLRTLLDSERQRAAQLEEQVVASTAELADLRGLRKVLDSENQRTAQLEAMLQDYQTDGTRLEVLMHDLQSEQQKCLEVEKRLEDAEEQLSSTKMQLEESTRKLEHEKLLTAQLQNQLETSSVGVRNESHSGSEKVETLRMQYDKMLASKDQEIFSLTIALKETRENAHNLDDKSLSETLEQARREVESIQEKSQQDIYRLESVVRELKDRLGSGKGAYTFDDIQSRDREIQELREANEAAQEWMGKAVEHSQQNAAQIAKLTEEKAALEHQLNEEHRRSSFGVSDTSQSPKQELLDKTTELASLKQDFESLESELKGLKKEKEEQQGLLDDLGIAMEDVRIMQQKLVEAEEARSVLEAKLSGNALHQEAEDLRAINAELESRIGEFQKWTEIAQNKIAEIMAARDALQKELDTTRKENEDLAKQVQTSSGEDTNEFEILTTTLQEIKSSKNMLEAEIEQMRSRNESLTKDLREARTIAEKATQGIEAVESRNDGENTAKVEELLEDLRQKEEELLAANEALSKDEEVIQKWEDRVLELETQLSGLRQQLQKQEEKLQEEEAAANDAITEWQNRCVELEGELQQAIQGKELTEQRLKLLENTQPQASQSEDPEQETKGNSPTDTSTYEERIGELEFALAAANDALSKHDEIVTQWEDRISALEATIESLQTQLHEQEAEANYAITQWQDEYTVAEDKCAGLESELQALKEKQNAQGETSQNQLEELLAQKQAELKDAQQMMESSTVSIQVMKDQISSLQSTVEKKEADALISVARLREQLELTENKSQQLQNELDAALTSKKEEDDVIRQKNEERQSQLKSLKEELNAKELDANDAISLWEERLIQSQAENNTLRQHMAELETLREQLVVQEAEANNVIGAWEERLSASEAENKDLRQKIGEVDLLKEQLALQEAEVHSVIAAWEERLNASEAENQQLQQQLEEATAQQGELHALREALSHDEEIVHKWESRANELCETVDSLKQQVESLQVELKEQEKDASEAISQWQENCARLENRCTDIESQLAHSIETIAGRDWTIEQLKSKIENYQLQMEKLKVDLQVNPAIEEELVNATSEISQLTRVLEAERQKRLDEREKFQAELADERGRHAEARDEIEALTASLDESEDIVNQWTKSFEEVSLELQDARIVLQNQETEANEAISIWEQKAAELESELDSAEAQLVVAEEKVAELHAKCKTLGSKEKSLKAELQSLQESHDLKVKQLSQELASKSKGALEAERDRLTIVITHLEEELLEANDMVQACITDESGDKATAAVAQALREEIEGLRLQMCDYRQKYEEEQASREVAQLEIERLRNDVAALVALSEEDNALENLEKLTTKAIEKLQKRERAEIDELRKSLFRALNDLEFSRAAEKESNEQLSKVRLQLAMYEQDVIAAKSEISFLTQAMEELRETEENKRASLEYRVGSLEHENDVVKKYHTAELDTVRNELSQVTMDRDRIIHQLKEVEKTNSSLVYAASKEENLRSERTGDFEAECIKLRIENAHLLTMAADDHSRAERRLHEMLAAQSASIEADVILQTELCVSAEEAVETLKVELEALRSERCSLIQDADPTLRKLEAEHMQELESTRASLQRVQRENESLKLKMEEATRKSMKKIETLTDECRRAQSLVHKMKQEGRFEAMVRAEKSRLSNNATQSPARLGNCHGEWGNGHLEPTLSSVEAFDMVERLKQEILQERKSHREFLEEHDLLLTMLGQLDSEKTALMEALGPVASEEAIQRAHQVSAE